MIGPSKKKIQYVLENARRQEEKMKKDVIAAIKIRTEAFESGIDIRFVPSNCRAPQAQGCWVAKDKATGIEAQSIWSEASAIKMLEGLLNKENN